MSQLLGGSSASELTMSPPNAYSSPSPTPSDDAAWLRAYMTSHSLSSRSKYYGYSFWAIVVGITLLYSLAHRFELRGGILGAWCNSVLLGRKRVPDCITWVYDRFKCRRIKTRRPVHFPSNGRLLGVLMLSSLVSILAFSGPDYLPPAEKSRQPETVIQKSWWTSAGRTGIMAFALLPLCILFALKGSPFSLFSSKFLVLLHFDKLAWLHRWSAGLLWLLTACHVGSWSVQLVLDEYPGSKQTVLSLVWSYPPFVYGWWGFVFLTLLIILSLKPIRNHHYELFFASHVLLVPPMLLTTSLHHPTVGLGTNFEYEPAASQSEPGIMFNNVPTKDTDMTSSSDVRSLYKPGLHGPEDDEMLDTQLEALDLVAFEGDEDVEIPGERRLSERVKRESKIRRTRSQRRLAGSSDFTQATSANAKFNPQLDRVPRPKPVASVCQYIDRRATPTCSPLTQAQRNNSVVSSEELSSYTPSRLAYVTGDRRNTRSFVSTRKHAPKLFKDIERRTGNPKDYQFTTGIPHTSDTPRFRLQMSEVEMNDINVISEFALPGKPKLEHILQEEMDAVKGPIVVACCGPTSLNTMVRECIVSQTDLGSAWRGGGRGHISFVSEEFEY
ncbi:hypothetical protein D9756_001543 [Leucocoprinus leucothites]|uniref:Ferric oxidoreductase domain-containing protein n=1 Tax=Leucocoprinus leucothites TaxID=201217 RepID=A0A8H5LI70_9AGAR|nr:hypothetical protein D9756_001543 [Leucoagaricus leucothites]